METTLYTNTTAVRCKVYKMVCVDRKCIVKWNGLAENIYRISEQTCIVEEICWDFVDMVTSMKCNFSAFSMHLKASYERHHSFKPFMSAKTFQKTFFSWASHQNVDFRKCCTWCGPSPNVLACDGTKIGILQQNCNIKPLEKSDSSDRIETQFRRFDRCFLANPSRIPGISSYQQKEREQAVRECRKHLKIQTTRGSTIHPAETPLDAQALDVKLLQLLPTPCKPLWLKYRSQQLNLQQLTVTQKVFHLLSFDAPLRSFMSPLLVPVISQLLEITTNQDTNNLIRIIDECQRYNPSLANFISAFTTDGILDEDAASLLRYIHSKVNEIHDQDVEPVPPIPQIHSYNPPELGRAYYFTPSGSQVRSTRLFTIDGPTISSHDDVPTTSSCTKNYGKISKKGASFLFLWFCPQHGHCYGCHIVDGCEGRKDPACSLVTHLPKAPDVIFYDFACSLEEYCLNRESGYFKNTRFYHDIFHGFSHNCSKVYSSKGIKGLESVNTSICEQFNSFLQCIKGSAKHMSQEHFMFYVQFMIDIWNRKKKLSFSKKLKIALSGAQ